MILLDGKLGSFLFGLCLKIRKQFKLAIFLFQLVLKQKYHSLFYAPS